METAEVERRERESWELKMQDWIPVVQEKPDAPVNARFEASCPPRQIVYCGETRELALASLIQGYVRLSRDGSINPARPHLVGVQPLQHVMELLQEQLEFAISQRYDDWRVLAHDRENYERAVDKETTGGGAWLRDPRFTRRNEVISGLATAIAALARVKEL